MIIKLDTSIFRLAGASKAEKVKKISKPLTEAEWINADRIVIAVLFALVIIGAILY